MPKRRAVGTGIIQGNNIVANGMVIDGDRVIFDSTQSSESSDSSDSDYDTSYSVAYGPNSVAKNKGVINFVGDKKILDKDVFGGKFTATHQAIGPGAIAQVVTRSIPSNSGSKTIHITDDGIFSDRDVVVTAGRSVNVGGVVFSGKFKDSPIAVQGVQSTVVRPSQTKLVQLNSNGLFVDLQNVSGKVKYCQDGSFCSFNVIDTMLIIVEDADKQKYFLPEGDYKMKSGRLYTIEINPDAGKPIALTCAKVEEEVLQKQSNTPKAEDKYTITKSDIDNENIETKKLKINEMSEGELCIICFERRRAQIMFRPCNHFKIACMKCIDGLVAKRCPFCNVDYANIEKCFST